jgi:hypothetical protein
MHERPHIVGEVILHQHGCFRRVRQYLAGWHAELGALHFGWSGPETIVERDIILPARVLYAVPPPVDAPGSAAD